MSYTPFETAKELKDAQNEILESEWKRFEKARVRKQLLENAEFKFILETFKKGLDCKFGGESDDSLVRVFLDDNGTQQIHINKELESKENMEVVVGTLVKSLTESFYTNYLRTLGIADIEPDKDASQQIATAIGKRSTKNKKS